ncbi:MAG: phosphoribosylglycinamide formyltransferase [Eubacteriales bacterium]|nr:phosphoribosylglycinamide formyltransferase [Eubacteriales bacterium]
MLKARIAVFVSGGGTNLQALFNAEDAGALTSGGIVLVLSDHAEAFALERAARRGVPTAVEERRAYASDESWETAVLTTLRTHNIDCIILAGFLRILSPAFVRAYPNRIVNVHPSLIPAFCGKGYYGLRVHEAALRRGVKLTGATVHLVNEVPDGGPILLQKAVAVQPGDTPEALQRRVMEEAEWQLLPEAAELLSKEIVKQKA